MGRLLSHWILACVGALAVVAANAQTTEELQRQKLIAEIQQIKQGTAKSQLPTPPDPSKYSVSLPTTIELTGQVSHAAYLSASELANAMASEISSVIASDIGSKELKCPTRTLLTDSDEIANLLSVYDFVTTAFLAQESRLAGKNAEMNKRLGIPSVEAKALIAGPAGVSAIAETVMAFATALKPKVETKSVPTLTTVQGVLPVLLFGKLNNATPKISTINPDAILIDQMADSTVKATYEKLSTSMDDARKTLEAADTKIADLIKKAGGDEKSKPARQAADLSATAKELRTLLDESVKLQVDSRLSDGSKPSPYMLAQRGEKLKDYLSSSCTYLLDLNVVSAAADIVARDGIFRSLRIDMSHSMVASWRIVNTNGLVIAQQVDAISPKFERVTLP